MNYATVNGSIEPSEKDVKCFLTYLQLADDQWPHEADEDGTFLIASTSGLIVRLSPASHCRAFAWTEVGPAVPDERRADVMGLGLSLSESLFPALGCQFFRDQLDRPCVGYTHPLPDLGKWIDTELMDKASRVEKGYEDLFDEAIDIQIEANNAVEHLVETVSHFCDLINPAIGPLAAEAIPPIVAAAIARDTIVQEAKYSAQGRVMDCISESDDVYAPLPDDSQARYYSNCQAIRLIRGHYSSLIGQNFVDGKLCRLNVSNLENGTIIATMRLPGSKSHNLRISIALARARLLGEHYLEDPESIWKYVSIRLDDGEVVFRKTWTLDTPSPEDIDIFARDAMSFISQYGEDMLDAGDPTRFSRLFDVDTAEDSSDNTCETEGHQMHERTENPCRPIVSVPLVFTNVYDVDNDEPF